MAEIHNWLRDQSARLDLLTQTTRFLLEVKAPSDRGREVCERALKEMSSWAEATEATLTEVERDRMNQRIARHPWDAWTDLSHVTDMMPHQTFKATSAIFQGRPVVILQRAWHKGVLVLSSDEFEDFKEMYGAYIAYN